MENVYIQYSSLKIKRKSYSWDLGNIRLIRERLKFRVKDKTNACITYEEYQQCMMLLMLRGYIKLE